MIPDGRPPRRQNGRLLLPGAIVASLFVHALAVFAYFGLGDTYPPHTPATPEQPAIAVEILADPRRGVPSPPESSTTEPADNTAEIPPAEPPRNEAAEPHPANPREATPVPVPPPPPPAPPPVQTARAASPPSPNLPPARLQSGASDDGRDDGTTDIILGKDTVPPSKDPSAQNIPPRYPPEAVRRLQQGTVQLSVLVATDGSVLSVDVAASSGYPLLDRAARQAVAKWHFKPGTQDGLAMPATVPVTLEFTLVTHR